MKVLMIGGTGLLGSQTARELISLISQVANVAQVLVTKHISQISLILRRLLRHQVPTAHQYCRPTGARAACQKPNANT